MSFIFKPATREGIHAIVGMIGGTGSGKTYSAMELASGICGKKRFAVIDTEAGRAKHYADRFHFDHGDLAPPFSPSRYLEAIVAAEKAGYGAIVVDSMSHEHAGEGGLLDMHEEEWAKKDNRESAKMTAWIKPKGEHKKMVQRLLQLRSHLILCFRAEPKLKMQKDATGKMQVVDMGWQPICDKNLPFELTVSFLLSHERPGFPDHPLKLPEPLLGVFPSDRPISALNGAQLAKWAAGDTKPVASSPATVAIGPLLDDIGAARNLTELKAVGKLIKVADVPDEQLAELRAAYAKKQKSLSPKEVRS